VEARLDVRRRGDAGRDAPPLVLDGEALQLRAIAVDGRPLPADEYTATPLRLEIFTVPAAFTLTTTVEIHPETNTELNGLYRSSGNFCTQCEADGFRKITYFLDRPDVMARYSVHVEADKTRYPVLLSNGNRVETGDLADGRHYARWDDPFPKPSYLFALVAGDLRCHPASSRPRCRAGPSASRSGSSRRTSTAAPTPSARCRNRCVGRAAFGREYDLDIYMIVAVGDFNMGAMENKGLNIFNSKYVLARPDTATDDDYNAIESVIAHEYFHNWTGNRVTCRDWFQLTLKEGLTVFRDRLFSPTWARPRSSGSPTCWPCATASSPRTRPDGPPDPPESYIEMNNFYTATVYEKGAEVIGMLRTLLGPRRLPPRHGPLLRAPRRPGRHLRRLRAGDGRRQRPRPRAVRPLVQPGRHPRRPRPRRF
jgi:aminopeptidase N